MGSCLAASVRRSWTAAGYVKLSTRFCFCIHVPWNTFVLHSVLQGAMWAAMRELKHLESFGSFLKSSFKATRLRDSHICSYGATGQENTLVTPTWSEWSPMRILCPEPWTLLMPWRGRSDHWVPSLAHPVKPRGLRIGRLIHIPCLAI